MAYVEGIDLSRFTRKGLLEQNEPARVKWTEDPRREKNPDISFSGNLKKILTGRKESATEDESQGRVKQTLSLLRTHLSTEELQELTAQLSGGAVRTTAEPSTPSSDWTKSVLSNIDDSLSHRPEVKVRQRYLWHPRVEQGTNKQVGFYDPNDVYHPLKEGEEFVIIGDDGYIRTKDGLQRVELEPTF